MIFVIQRKNTKKEPFYQRLIPKIQVAVYRDRMVVLNPDGSPGAEHRPKAGYATERLLIGSMTNAIACLNQAITISEKRIQWRPDVLLQDMVFLDEEISEVEYRILEEVGYKAGASNVSVRDRLGKPVKRNYG